MFWNLDKVVKFIENIKYFQKAIKIVNNKIKNFK